MRGKKIQKRTIEPDYVYKSRLVSRMVNNIMERGKKAMAQNILFSAMDKLSEDKKESLRIFEQAIKNVMPQQEVRSKRVGGASYQVPMPLEHDRAEALAIRWLTNAARNKKGKPMLEKLYEEIKNAYDGTGDAIRKKDETHRMAEANKAFSHFARF